MEENKNIEEGSKGKEESEKLREEIISSAESMMPGTEEQLLNVKPLNDLNENMEVHHHTHAGHGKKNWKSYFWEFLMLFLAVFCGFLAEYQLEHKIERDRAKQYIISLYEDLKNDTARINKLIAYDNEKIMALNNMFACYDTVLRNLKATSCMGILIKHSRSNKGFVLTDRTLKQLANAGGYRLLNKEDADSIIVYENMYKGYLDFQTTVFQHAQDNVRNTLNQIADFKVIAPIQLTTATMDRDTTSSTLNGPLLFTDDKFLLNKWFNELSMYLRVTNGQRNSITQIKNKATDLILYYKTKYHLD